MCLAVPARIVELEGDNAVVDAMGNRFRAKTTLLPEAKLGTLVLVHAGLDDAADQAQDDGRSRAGSKGNVRYDALDGGFADFGVGVGEGESLLAPGLAGAYGRYL